MSETNTPPPLDSSSFKLVLRIPEREEELDEDGEPIPDYDKEEMPWLSRHFYQVVSCEGKKVGELELYVCDRDEMEYAFHDSMDEPDHEIAELGLIVFDNNGSIRSKFKTIGNACWGWELDDSLITGIRSFILDEEVRGNGLGSYVLQKLWEEPELQYTDFIFVSPGIINRLETRRRPDDSAPQEDKDSFKAYWTSKFDMITRFWQKNGYRRVGFTEFLCCARSPTHPSKLIPIELDPASKDDSVQQMGLLANQEGMDNLSLWERVRAKGLMI